MKDRKIIILKYFSLLYTYQADSDRVWYLHSVYSLKAGRSKREVTSDSHNTLEPRIGRNVIRIRVSRRPQQTADLNLSSSVDTKNKQQATLMPILIGLSVLLLIILIVLIVVIRRRKKRSSPPPSPTNTITVVGRSGKAMVVQLPDSKSTVQRSEV